MGRLLYSEPMQHAGLQKHVERDMLVWAWQISVHVRYFCCCVWLLFGNCFQHIPKLTSLFEVSHTFTIGRGCGVFQFPLVPMSLLSSSLVRNFGFEAV